MVGLTCWSAELPDAVDVRLGEIEAALEARPIRYGADDLALAGAFVGIDSSGPLRVERGYVQPEDEPVDEVEGANEAMTAAFEVTDDTVAGQAQARVGRLETSVRV